MQDGFIFSETIAENIAIGEEVIDKERLLKAAQIANIDQFIDSLPLGYNTKIGMEGSGISQGQRQRILIARAVYKNPDFLFFDEATNALDANNEREIMEHLNEFIEEKQLLLWPIGFRPYRMRIRLSYWIKGGSSKRALIRS